MDALDHLRPLRAGLGQRSPNSEPYLPIPSDGKDAESSTPERPLLKAVLKNRSVHEKELSLLILLPNLQEEEEEAVPESPVNNLSLRLEALRRALTTLCQG